MTEPIEAAALKPCPFCGGEAAYYASREAVFRATWIGHVYHCTKCQARVQDTNRRTAQEMWNRRPAASGDLRERIAREMKIAFVERTMHSPVGQYANTIDHLFAVMAEIAIASLPGRDEEVLLDRVVKFDDCETAEPTLRQMIRQYYIQGLQPDTEHALELSGRFVRSLKTESGS